MEWLGEGGILFFFVSFSRTRVVELGGKTCTIIGRKVSFLPDTHCVTASSGRLVANIVAGYNSNLISLNILLYTAQCRPCLNVVLCGPRDFKIDYILYIYIHVCVCVVPRIYLYKGGEIDEEYRFRSTSGFPECQQSWTTTIKILITNSLISIRWHTLGPPSPSHPTDVS